MKGGALDSCGEMKIVKQFSSGIRRDGGDLSRVGVKKGGKRPR